jgi:phosphoglycolate phosphatase
VGNADVVGDLHRLIAFDLDGTLVDSQLDLANSANELIEELGGAPLSVDAVAGMVGEGAALLVRRALTAAHLGEVEGALPRFLQIYDRRLLEHTRLYDGVLDVVRAARARARVAILTNKPLVPSLRIADALGLRPLVDDVVGGDNAWGRKPDPGALQALMADAGADRESTLMVGDSAIDHETAVRAGVRAYLLSFGFGFRRFPADRLRPDDRVAPDAATLLALIEQF